MSGYLLSVCKNDFEKRAAILYYCGFGFQGPPPDWFVLAALSKELSDEKIAEINEKSGTNSVYNIDNYGHSFLGINSAEYPKHAIVLTKLLELGISFRTHSNLNARFNPENDLEYSQEKAELNAITEFYEDVANFGLPYELYMIPHKHRNFPKLWNWTTKEGKEFCVELRSKMGKKKANMESKQNYWKSDIFKNYDPKTLQSIEPDKQKQEP